MKPAYLNGEGDETFDVSLPPRQLKLVLVRGVLPNEVLASTWRGAQGREPLDTGKERCESISVSSFTRFSVIRSVTQLEGDHNSRVP